jgi:hypothetical protein
MSIIKKELKIKKLKKKQKKTKQMYNEGQLLII